MRLIPFKKIVANKGYSNKSPMLYLAKKRQNKDTYLKHRMVN